MFNDFQQGILSLEGESLKNQYCNLFNAKLLLRLPLSHHSKSNHDPSKDSIIKF